MKKLKAISKRLVGVSVYSDWLDACVVVITQFGFARQEQIKSMIRYKVLNVWKLVSGCE